MIKMNKLKKILMVLALFSSLKASEYNEAEIQKGMQHLGLKNMDEIMIEFLKRTELKPFAKKIADNKDWFDREQIKILLGIDEKTLNDKLYNFITFGYLVSPAHLYLPIEDDVYKKYRKIYEIFLRAQLIYKPNKDNNDGMITFNFSDLSNPLEGEFDLSRCGDAGKYLSINTGLRTMARSSNHEGKVEYWFTPTFLIERVLQSLGKYLQDVWPSVSQSQVFTRITWYSWKLDAYYYHCLHFPPSRHATFQSTSTITSFNLSSDLLYNSTAPRKADTVTPNPHQELITGLRYGIKFFFQL